MKTFKSSLLPKMLGVCLIWMLCTGAYAQELSISGKVTEEDGQPLPGVNISVQGTNTGTVSNVNGQFNLTVNNAADTLVFSFVGYETQKKPINNRSEINVILRQGVTALEELVVMGYDEQQKNDITGAVSQVSPEDIQNLPSESVSEMLEGRVPGVQFLSDNEPGGGKTLRIRGFSTINNNEPLYIIDGVPTQSGMNMINPNDIASIQVMKDAAASSIYGSRAANGVVIITTHQGNTDEPTLSFNAYAGVNQAYNLPEMLNAREYGEVLWQGIKNDGGTPSSDVYGDNAQEPQIPKYLDDDQTVPSDDVDWVNQIFEPAVMQNYHLKLARGNDQSRQALTIGYFNQEGVIKHTDFERFSGRFNSEYKFFDRLTVGENLTASYSRRTNVGTNSMLGSVVLDAYQFPSIVPVKDNEGNFGGNPLSDTPNPMGSLYRNKDNNRNNFRAFGNIYANVEIIPDLNFKSSFGIDYSNFLYRHFNPEYHEIIPQRNVNSLSTNNASDFQYTWSNTLRYEKSLNDHNVNILLGQEAIQYTANNFSASREDFLYEDLNFRYLSYGSDNQRNSGSASEWSLLSYFGKVNYEYGNKYLASFTLRRDGTSRLTQNNWGTFPAFSAGWRINEEDFFNVNAVSQLKLRASWGQTGNQEVPNYSTLDSYTNNPYNSNYAISGQQEAVNIGLVQTRVANNDLKWETTTQSDIGLDLGLFDQRVTMAVDYFSKITKDILIFSSIPDTYGGSNDGVWTNGGKMTNNGLELALNYKSNPKNDFRYQVGLNFTKIKNKVNNLGGLSFIGLPNSVLHSVNFDQEVSRTYPGGPIGTFYGYEAMGLFQSEQQVDDHGVQPVAQPGDIRFEDINGDETLDDEDRTFIGSPQPDFQFGVKMDFQYRNFDLNMFFNGSYGNEIYDLTRFKGDFMNQSAYNKHSRITDAWSENNTDTSIPRLTLDDPNRNIRPSSYYVQDGSYVKLNNLQLAYEIPAGVFGDNPGMNFRIYGQVNNVFTITPYEGLTPEIGLQNYSSSYRNLDIGVDRGVYPPSRTYTIGLNINL